MKAKTVAQITFTLPVNEREASQLMGRLATLEEAHEHDMVVYDAVLVSVYAGTKAHEAVQDLVEEIRAKEAIKK